MSGPDAKPFTFGNVSGTIMDFASAGDTLPMHAHDESTIHFTVVARGSFIGRGPGWEKTLSAGDVIDWKVGAPHEFEAVEPNSRIVNIVKGGARPLAQGVE